MRLFPTTSRVQDHLLTSGFRVPGDAMVTFRELDLVEMHDISTSETADHS